MNDWIPYTNGSLVAVSLQYRLGLLGFLASSDIAKDGALNNGLLDQRMALSWIHRYVVIIRCGIFAHRLSSVDI